MKIHYHQTFFCLLLVTRLLFLTVITSVIREFPQQAWNLLVTEERYQALFCMPQHKFLHNLLIALEQITSKMGL
jgi:hypothetical protein